MVAFGVMSQDASSNSIPSPISNLVNGKQNLTLANLTAGDFSPHVDSAFLIRSESQLPKRVILHQVLEYTTKRDEMRPRNLRAAFSVFFRGASGDKLEQGTYRMDHDELGTFELFLVPIGSGRDATVFEAVFA